MVRYFTADDHFGHANILHFGEGRPFRSLSHMHTEIINRHNMIVSRDDDVYFLGDIAMGSFEETIKLFKRMNGNKFLVPGNHEKIFSGANTHKRIATFTPLYEKAGFTILPENTSIFINGQKVIMSHFPYYGDHVGVERFVDNRPKFEGLPLLHGHTHQQMKTVASDDLMFHVGVDSNDYKPVSETEIAEWIADLKKRKLIK